MEVWVGGVVGRALVLCITDANVLVVCVWCVIVAGRRTSGMSRVLWPVAVSIQH
jgi:hypothetical protein